MVISNAQVIYTDPENPDCDDDGLKDGQEITSDDPQITVKEDLESQETYTCVVFRYCSDPWNKDTDNDGFFDNEDNNPLEFIKSHKLKENDKAELKKSLLEQIENDMAFTTWIKSLHNAEYCVDTVINYDDIITEYANIYKIPKAYIQSVLLRELYCYGLDDPLGDLGFVNYCMYNRECEFYYSQSSSYQQVIPAPQIPLIYREDTSTGIGQILTQTALNAYNYAVDRGFKKEKLDNNWSNREKFFYNLKDDVYSIDMIALVLMYGWYDNMTFIDSYTEKYWSLTVEQKKTMFSIYNCGETIISGYGEAVYNSYEIFEKYQ